MQHFGLLRPIGQTRWLLAGQLCPTKCISAGTSGFALRSIVFGAPLHFWTLWIFESLYICLDRLIQCTLVHEDGHEKKHPKLYWPDFWCGA